MARLVVIGSGAMGLSAAYFAAKKGYDVTVLEASPEPGGMAAHFDFDGLSIERFYHFICKSDQATFDLLAELGLSEKMKWVPTTMGYYLQGRLYPWGDPLSLLRFPGLSLGEKIRYAAMMFFAAKRTKAGRLDRISAKDWITSWCGERVYRAMWDPLFKLKFYEFADDISAAWLWTRIKRVGTSRRSIMQEELGHIEGGSEILVHALICSIEQMGGRIFLNAPATEIVTRDGRVKEIVSQERRFQADAVISTIPTPLLKFIKLRLAEEELKKYDAIRNIGVVCVVLKLKKSITPHFWVNIADRDFEIPGIIEFSHLRRLGHTIVYVPYYMPSTNPKFKKTDSAFVAESLSYLRRLNPDLTDSDLIASRVGRLKYAQPVCPPGFKESLPLIQTSIAGLQIADTCFYYPEDRGISESVKLAKSMVDDLPISNR